MGFDQNRYTWLKAPFGRFQRNTYIFGIEAHRANVVSPIVFVQKKGTFCILFLNSTSEKTVKNDLSLSESSGGSHRSSRSGNKLSIALILCSLNK